MTWDALIFDFDGVIVDSEPLHCRAFQTVLGPLGIRFTWEEYLRDYVGFDDRDALRFAFSSHHMDLSPGQMDALIAEKAAEFSRFAADPAVSLYPGVQDILDTFKGKLPIAVCSGALRQDIEPVVSRFGIGDAFELMITADQVEKSKPDPESYRMTLQALEQKHGPLEKTRCAVIEDTPAGVTSAKEAGLFAIGVTHTHPAQSLGLADFVADSLSGVLSFLTSGQVP